MQTTSALPSARALMWSCPNCVAFDAAPCNRQKQPRQTTCHRRAEPCHAGGAPIYADAFAPDKGASIAETSVRCMLTAGSTDVWYGRRSAAPKSQRRVLRASRPAGRQVRRWPSRRTGRRRTPGCAGPAARSGERERHGIWRECKVKVYMEVCGSGSRLLSRPKSTWLSRSQSLTGYG